MVLRARQEGKVLILDLEGHLDFETNMLFRETCQKLIKKANNPRLVFNLRGLKFVGSSGISQFIKTMKEFNSKRERPRLCMVSSEFEKLFRAYQTIRHPFQIFDQEKTALESFDAPPPLKRTKSKHWH